MKYIRARINTVHTKSLRCSINRAQVLEQELENRIADSEYSYEKWIETSMSATFSLKDPKLYDFALSLLDKDVLLGIENATIVSIEPP